MGTRCCAEKSEIPASTGIEPQQLKFDGSDDAIFKAADDTDVLTPGDDGPLKPNGHAEAETTIVEDHSARCNVTESCMENSGPQVDEIRGDTHRDEQPEHQSNGDTPTDEDAKKESPSGGDLGEQKSKAAKEASPKKKAATETNRRGSDPGAVSEAPSSSTTPAKAAVQRKTPTAKKKAQQEAAERKKRDSRVVQKWMEDPGENMCKAAQDGNVRMLKLMLEAGASPETKDQRGCFAMLEACRGSKTDVVKCLIDAKADVNKLGILTDGNTSALHVAAKFGKREMIDLLIEAGADLNLKSSRNEYPVDVAEKFKQKEIAKYLRERSGK